MPTSQQKGDALENAVRAIETAILQQSPGYDEKTFRIEGKKKIKTKDGVPHEIDIWVTVEIAPGYTATYIFECKNWKKKVGKADVSVFADKIRDVQAQKGFLVANALTQGALARLKSEQRMELLQVRELSLDEVSERLKRFYAVFSEICEKQCVFQRYNEKSEGEVVDLTTAVFTIAGEEHDLDSYFNEWFKNLATTCPSTEGLHSFEASRVFSDDELMLNRQPIKEIKVSGKLRVSWIPSVIVSRFEVTSRGRVAQSLVTLPNGASVVMQELRLSHKG